MLSFNRRIPKPISPSRGPGEIRQYRRAAFLTEKERKCWADEGFKKKLLADATATLKAAGEELPAGLTFKAVENTDKLVHLVIPPKPADLSDEDLDAAVGGVMTSTGLYFRKWLKETTECYCGGNLLCD